MKPAAFGYSVPASASGARGTLEQAGGTAKLVAGSQSLGPLLNLRLTRPGALVDVAMLPELRATRETADGVTIGAATTHAEIEDGDVPDPTPGWLGKVAANIAHRAVRNRGTLGGSLAHADPAADWPVVMLALEAVIIIEGPDGRREVAAEDFLTGPFETCLGPADLIIAVSVPRPPAAAGWAYWKYCRQVGEFAKASAAVLTLSSSGEPRIAIGALSSQPQLITGEAARRLLAGAVDVGEAVSDLLPDTASRERALHVTALGNALGLATDAAGKQP